jgi:transcriptional regulator with XRE-family HTH domain
VKIVIEVDLNFLCDMRNRYGLSISDVAAKLGYKTPTGYWLIENGQRKVSVRVLYKLAKLYNHSMEDFLIIRE